MATIDLGKLKFQWKGTYAGSTAYEKDDVVAYDGAAYVATADIPASNTQNPYLNSDFDVMVEGFNYDAAWSSSISYQKNDVVLYNAGLWIALQTTTVGEIPSSASTQWETFVPAPANNVLTTIGDMVVRDNDNNTARLPVGPKGATLKVQESPNHSIPANITYSVGTGTPATGIATDGDDATNVYGDNTANGAINVSRERTYVFTFPADGLTYSIKDPNAAGYSTTGIGGRVTVGVHPDSVTNGGTITLRVLSTTPTTLKVRNESGGADEVTVTVKTLSLVPSFDTSNDVRTDTGHVAYRAANDWRNTLTTSLQEIVRNPEFGRGSKGRPPGSAAELSYSIQTTEGRIINWGQYSVTATYTGSGSDATGSITNNISYDVYQSQMAVPPWFESAIAGVAADAKFLTDRDGNDLGYKTICTPKIVEHIRTRSELFALTENGIIFSAGAGAGTGSNGAGGVEAAKYALTALRTYDSNGTTELTGANRPKFKEIIYGTYGIRAANAILPKGTFYGLSTDGELFAMGANTNGQLADGTTTDNYFFKRIPKSVFGGEDIIYCSSYGGGGGGSTATVHTTYAVTATGKLWGWGNNTYGQLGNNASGVAAVSTPIEMTAVAGSAINGKTVIHLMGNNYDWNDTPRLYILTTEGKVYMVGRSLTFGAYSGLYKTVTTSIISLPEELTDAATTINSDNQKVQSMWMSQYANGTQWFITDGGDSGLQRIYSCGGNAYNQQGTTAGTTQTASATSQGDWTLKECVYRTGSDDASCLTRANVTNQKIGDPCMVFTAGSETTPQFYMLDSNGQLFITGVWTTYNPVLYTEDDGGTNNYNDFDGTATNVQGWNIVTTQPEPCESFIAGLSASGQENWCMIAKSGNVYVGGVAAAYHTPKNIGGWHRKSLAGTSGT